MKRLFFLIGIFAVVCFQMGALSEAEIAAKMKEAEELLNNDKYEQALENFLIVGENTKRQRTDAEREVYIISRNMASLCYYRLKRYGESYQMSKDLLKCKLTDEMRKNVAHQYSLSGAAYACGFMKKDADGKADYRRGREIFTEVLPYTDGRVKGFIETKIPLSWYLEAVSNYKNGNFENALGLYEKAREGFKDLGNVKEEIDCVCAIAEIEFELCDFENARASYAEANMLAKRAGDADKQMEILGKQWNMASALNDASFMRRVGADVDSLKEVVGSDRVKLALYIQKGDEARGNRQYELSEKWYMKVKSMAKSENPDAFSENRHTVYLRLVNLYADMERYSDALEYAKKVTVESQKGLAPADEGYYMSYMHQTTLYQRMGEREKAFACIDTLFLEKDKTNNPRLLSLCYKTRASCNAAFGDLRSALDDYKKADEILSSNPQLMPDRCIILAQMGGIESKMGLYKESEEHYRQYADCMRELYGEKSLNYVEWLIVLANAEGFSNNIESGCNDYTKATRILRSLMKENVPYMSVMEREGFWQSVSKLFTQMPPYAIEAGHRQSSFTASCYDALVLSKAFLLESERTLFEVVKNEGTREDMQDYMRLTQLRNKIKELEKESEKNADSILALSEEVERLSIRLAERCRSFSDVSGYIDISYADVKCALKPGEVLLDFTDYVSKSRGRRYAAFVIDRNDKYPLLKSLFDEKSIDSLGIVRADMYYNPDYAPDVLKLLWEPLKEHIAEGSTVYYVPTQVLFQISIESLPLEDGSLLGEHYNFVRLSSARELVKPHSTMLSANPRTAMLYGGLQYDLQPTDMAEQAKKYDVPELLAMRGEIMRGDSIFHELPGSRKEISDIAEILEKNDWCVTRKMGMDGTEESFLCMHGNSPQVLQVATHGFYYTPDVAEGIDYLKGYTDAMNLSGIVLSGANVAWQGKELPEGVMGGILTANNIARMDLGNTEMVVLSACRSGQGKATSEGLYGLQRAFKKAGVGTMVMTLWNVSDVVSTEYMRTFYEQLASCGWDKRKAFERAKSIIRSKYPKPYYWAAFVMVD